MFLIDPQGWTDIGGENFAPASSSGKVIQRAMQTKLGNDTEEVTAALAKAGIGRSLARQAIELAQEQGRFTVFAMVDALTRLRAGM